MAGEHRRGGKKNRKHGRQARRPSGKQQAARTAHNKQVAQERRERWLQKRRGGRVV